MNPKAREFENDTYLKAELERLILKWKVRTVIETGTEYGGSANAFVGMKPVEAVITIDIERKVKPDELLGNVTFLLGDSRKVLKSVPKQWLEHPILFFLDAHSSIATDECPLRGELEAVLNQGFTQPPIIVIHDCKVPGKDFGFDTYRDGPICWEGVRDLIECIYQDGYLHWFNTKTAGSKRGCLFIEPKLPEWWKPTLEEEARMHE